MSSSSYKIVGNKHRSDKKNLLILLRACNCYRPSYCYCSFNFTLSTANVENKFQFSRRDKFIDANVKKIDPKPKYKQQEAEEKKKLSKLNANFISSMMVKNSMPQTTGFSSSGSCVICVKHLFSTLI